MNKDKNLNKGSVAITTFYGNTNQGSALQLYALYSKIIQLGYTPLVMDFLNTKNLSYKLIRFCTMFNRGIGLIKEPGLFKYRELAKGGLLLPETIEKYNDFYKKNFLYTSDVYSKLSDIDAFITGSDQVWNLQVPNLHYTFYLRFVNKEKRIAYAASFGCNYIPEYNRKKLNAYLKDMRFISVREHSGAAIVKETINREVLVALDPVLLVGKEFWDNEIRGQNKQDFKYILCYFLDESLIGETLAQRIKRELNIEVRLVDTGVSFDNCKAEALDPIQFVDLIKHAEYIITDSFHATAFSLLYSKKYYTISRQYKSRKEQKDRILSLMELTKTEDRYIQTFEETEQIDICKTYDFEYVETILQKKRCESELYLINSLESVICDKNRKDMEGRI